MALATSSFGQLLHCDTWPQAACSMQQLEILLTSLQKSKHNNNNNNSDSSSSNTTSVDCKVSH